MTLNSQYARVYFMECKLYVFGANCVGINEERDFCYQQETLAFDVRMLCGFPAEIDGVTSVW